MDTTNNREFWWKFETDINTPQQPNCIYIYIFILNTFISSVPLEWGWLLVHLCTNRRVKIDSDCYIKTRPSDEYNILKGIGIISNILMTINTSSVASAMLIKVTAYGY